MDKNTEEDRFGKKEFLRIINEQKSAKGIGC